MEKMYLTHMSANIDFIIFKRGGIIGGASGGKEISINMFKNVSAEHVRTQPGGGGGVMRIVTPPPIKLILRGKGEEIKKGRGGGN